MTQIGKYEEVEQLKFIITSGQKMICYMLMQRYALSMKDFIWTLASFSVIKYKRINSQQKKKKSTNALLLEIFLLKSYPLLS